MRRARNTSGETSFLPRCLKPRHLSGFKLATCAETKFPRYLTASASPCWKEEAKARNEKNKKDRIGRPKGEHRGLFIFFVGAPFPLESYKYDYAYCLSNLGKLPD